MCIGQPKMKHERKKRITISATRWLIVCAAGFWLLVGCAGTSLPPASDPSLPDALAPVPDGHGWWSVRFRMDRPDDKTRWESDLLIAHRIVAPLVKAYRRDIELWRFHRRFAKDSMGHQFSFLFFASAETALRINQQVIVDPVVEQLFSSGTVVEVLTDDVTHNDRRAVGDTSDANWSPVMQDNWPYFIMGASRMWLGMIDQASRHIGIEDEPTHDQLLDHYQKVNNQVTHIWQNESQHALLHHLNAIFGYEPMILKETRWKAF